MRSGRVRARPRRSEEEEQLHAAHRHLMVRGRGSSGRRYAHVRGPRSPINGRRSSSPWRALVMSETRNVGIEALTELALNMRSTWNRSTDELWAELDPELWALTHNPWAVLQTVSPVRVQELLARPDYRQRVKDLIERRHEYLTSPAWFQQTQPLSPLKRVAYFSMEFALSEALPIYSGGLGNVAGDQLKAASDLRVKSCPRFIRETRARSRRPGSRRCAPTWRVSPRSSRRIAWCGNTPIRITCRRQRAIGRDQPTRARSERSSSAGRAISSDTGPTRGSAHSGRRRTK